MIRSLPIRLQKPWRKAGRKAGEKPDSNGNRRGRYREFAIGRYWWIMPAAMLSGQVVAFFLLEQWTRFNGQSAWDWVLFVSLMIGSPTLAAILLSPGFTRYHVAMAVLAVGSGGAVFAWEGEWAPELVVVSFIVTAIQAFAIRMTGKLPWLIRPAKSGREPKASIRWLLAMTVVAAVLIAWIRQTDDWETYYLSLVYLGLAMTTALAGNVVATLRSARTRWGILVVAALLGTAVRWGVESGVLPGIESVVDSSRFSANILGVAPAASLIIITLVHRMMTVKWEAGTSDPFGTSSESAEQHQAMLRHRRRVAQSRTPQEHAAIVEQLQITAMQAIRNDPAAYQAFLVRNHRKRRSDEVARLATKLMPNDSSYE